MIGLVSCSAQKAALPRTARTLYTSPLFRLSLEYAERRCMTVYVLSAKHGLVPLDEMLMPYELKLSSLRKVERQSWAARVRASLYARHRNYEELLVLAGDDYVRPLRTELAFAAWAGQIHEPLAGKQIGERLAWLNAELAAMPKQLPAPGPESTAQARWFVGGERRDGCSFCGVRVGRMCSGPGAAICADCVRLCADILDANQEAA